MANQYANDSSQLVEVFNKLNKVKEKKLRIGIDNKDHYKLIRKGNSHSKIKASIIGCWNYSKLKHGYGNWEKTQWSLILFF